MSRSASDKNARPAGRRAALLALAATLACGALLAVPLSASATFHLNMIREVYPGNLADPTAEYVELQAYAPGQNFVSSHAVTFYGAGGTKTGTATFNANVPNGQSQDTILIGTTTAASQFGVTPDLTIPAADLLSPVGGAVCWDTVDCVSWGNFSGGYLPSPAGAPAVAIPDGSALQRTISRGCPTALDEADDTNNSSADFAAAIVPSPRNNAMPPTEVLCTGGGPGGGGSGGSSSKAFSFGGVKDNKKSGTATLLVKVPGPGRLVLAGKGIRRVAKTVSATYFTGRVTLQVRPTGKAKTRLQTTHRTKVVVRVTFTPIGGNPISRSKTVKLVKR